MKFDFQGNSRARSSPSAQEARERIREGVQRLLGLEEEVPILVTELACQEEGCPPIETVIAILTTPGQPRQFKIHRPMVDLTHEDLETALAKSSNPCQDDHASQGE